MALDHRSGLHHGETGIRLAQELGNYRFGGFFVQFLANTYQKLGRFDDALEILEAGWVQAALIDGSCDQAEAQNALGFINWKLAKFSRKNSSKTQSAVALEHLTRATENAAKSCVAPHNSHELTNALY